MYNQMKQTISWLEYFTSAAGHGRRRFWLTIFVLYSLNTPAMCTRSLGVKKTGIIINSFSIIQAAQSIRHLLRPPF